MKDRDTPPEPNLNKHQAKHTGFVFVARISACTVIGCREMSKSTYDWFDRRMAELIA